MGRFIDARRTISREPPMEREGTSILRISKQRKLLCASLPFITKEDPRNVPGSLLKCKTARPVLKVRSQLAHSNDRLILKPVRDGLERRKISENPDGNFL